MSATKKKGTANGPNTSNKATASGNFKGENSRETPVLLEHANLLQSFEGFSYVKRIPSRISLLDFPPFQLPNRS